MRTPTQPEGARRGLRPEPVWSALDVPSRGPQTTVASGVADPTVRQLTCRALKTVAAPDLLARALRPAPAPRGPGGGSGTGGAVPCG
jgi:hypothetical protein